uniref:Glycoprotein n=1 Tax=European mountain ash ringspot-associated virus (isolate Sorbus aucuparia) TaxID=1980426 RepID=A0A4U8YT47_EMARV|nr:Glycoprotein precursor [European mountain ash ringspot-associated virus]
MLSVAQSSALFLLQAICILYITKLTVPTPVSEINLVRQSDCVCVPIISRSGTDYITCFNNCQIEPINTKLYNSTCTKMVNITLVRCNNEVYVMTLPNLVSNRSHSWEVLINYLLRFISAIIVYLLLSISKQGIFLFFSIVHYSFKFIKNKKSCNICGNDFYFIHIDCPKPDFTKRSDFHMMFYIILFLSLFFVVTHADDNVYNYYERGDLTEIQLLDKEHYSQDFVSDGFLYNFYVENSHLIYDVSNISTITRPVKHNEVTSTWSCDGSSGCYKDHVGKYNKKPDYVLKKVHDGFSCFFTTATICGTCKSEHIAIGDHVRVINVKPYIHIVVKTANKTDKIVIDEFNKFIHEPYYIKPITQIHIDQHDFLVTGSKVYQGTFCERPSKSCFGPNYITSDKTVTLHEPKIRDTFTHDREYIIDYCDYPSNSDLESLELTDMVHHSDKIYSPYDFGLISIGIPKLGYLAGGFCESLVSVKKIEVYGCYDCQNGVKISVTYESSDSCHTLICKHDSTTHRYFVQQHTTILNFHSFMSKKNTIIECNQMRKALNLDESSETSVYFESNSVKGSAKEPVNFDFIKNLLYIDYKKIIFVFLVAIISIGIFLRSPYMLLSSILKFRKRRKVVATNRSEQLVMDDDVDVFIGPPS